jgi:RNA-directed DNA polymerase
MADNIPTHKKKLKLWLKAGYMEKGTFYPTTEGASQGGVISPTTANMVLDNLQSILEAEFRRADKVHLVRYCDDFIITGNSKELLEERDNPIVIEFLKERGLETEIGSSKNEVERKNYFL